MLFDTMQAAERCKLACASLAKPRANGGGPPFVALGAKLLYDDADLTAWTWGRGERCSAAVNRLTECLALTRTDGRRALPGAPFRRCAPGRRGSPADLGAFA